MFGCNSIGGAMDYTLKIKYGTIISRIKMSRMGVHTPAMTFSKLEDTVRYKFKIPQTSKLNMVYTDIENDEVSITDDEDMYTALSQKMNPLRVTVWVPEPHQSAHDDCPCECRQRSFHALTGDLAAEIMLKLDQILLAVNKKLVEPKVELVTNTESAMIEHHVLEGVDASTIADSITKPSEDLTPAEDWTDIAQSGYDSEFLRRATILRQRVVADESIG